MSHQNTCREQYEATVYNFSKPKRSLKDTGTYFTFSSEPLPPAVILDMPRPGDQGMQCSCGAWAIVYGAGNYYMHVASGSPYNDSENLSPGFIYNQLSKGTSGITSLVDNIKLFKNEGACPFKYMPYNASDYFTQPDSLQCSRAEEYKIKGWQKIDPYNITLLKSAIAHKKPVIFSIATDDGFDQIAAPFIWKQRCGATGKGHTMVVAGYDDKKNAFWVMNSWGTGWGDNGFIWIDYQFFVRNALKEGYILL
jgi:C1A family cysteine protease